MVCVLSSAQETLKSFVETEIIDSEYVNDHHGVARQIAKTKSVVVWDWDTAYL